MKRYHGGEAVPKGVYLNLNTWEFTQLYEDKPMLPGAKETSYFKTPAPAMVVAGPLAGLVFIIFLPLIGIVGALSFLAYKMGRLAVTLGPKVVQPLAIAWKPGVAYFTRRGGARNNTGDRPGKSLEDKTINEIADEIARRRERGEK